MGACDLERLSSSILDAATSIPKGQCEGVL